MSEKYAQVDPSTIFFLPDGEYELKANKKYVFVFDLEKMTFSVESYWWFIFKNWFKKITVR